MKIDNSANFVKIAEDDVNYNVNLRKTMILSIEGALNELGCFVTISHYGGHYDFSLSDITNQVTWTNDQSGLNQAVNDISSWI